MKVSQHSLDLVMRRVTKEPGGCWLYRPPTSNRGRPRVTVNGQTMEAYRVVWYAYHPEPIPDGMYLLHSCDRGDEGCVNPHHLRIGTPSENNADAVERNRHRNQHTGKTACSKGHPFDERNTRIRPDGSRACRACEAARTRTRQAGTDQPTG